MPSTLTLGTADARPGRGSFWSFFYPFRGELSVDGLSEGEVLARAGEHSGLLRRHGWRRVLSFYEVQLLPALERLTSNAETWRARFEVGCRALALRASYQPDRWLVHLARSLGDQLLRATFSSDPRESLRLRAQVRIFLADQLVRAAARLEELGDHTAALAACEALDRAGAGALETVPGEHHKRFARLLWRHGERGPRALAVYLRHCRDLGFAAVEPLALRSFLEARLRIEEGTPLNELAGRIQSNQMLLPCRQAPPDTACNIGLGYLGLGQPERALPYLESTLTHLADAPDDTRAGLHFHLGRALFLTGASTAAAEAFETAEAAGFPRARIVSWQALALARAGQYERAEALFDEAAPGVEAAHAAELHLQWGRASFLAGRVEEALGRFHRALELEGGDPSQTDPRIALGRAICLQRLERPVEALAGLLPSADVHLDFAPLTHRLGCLFESTGDRDKASTWYRRAVRRRPQDPHFALSLGLLLDDLGSPEALPHLARAADAEVGGPEVLRRLGLTCRRQHPPDLYQRYLERWAAHPAAAPDGLTFLGRDLARRATAASNAGRHGEATRLARRARGMLTDGEPVRTWLAHILLRDAAARLAEGEGEIAWRQIEEAHTLAELPDTRFYRAAARLAQGEVDAAHQQLRQLVGELPERSDYRLLADFAATLDGDAEAARRLEGGNAASPTLGPVLTLMKIRQILERGDLAAAAGWVKERLETPENLGNLGLAAPQLSLLTAFCLVRGTRSRKQRVLKILEAQHDQHPETWELALLLARHLLATAGGRERAEQADLELLASLAGRYQELTEKAVGTPGEVVLRWARSDLLHYRLVAELSHQNLAAAHAIHGQLQEICNTSSPALTTLGRALTQRMKHPSHAKACALLGSDPAAARKVFRTLHRRDPEDFHTLHHLACLAWSRAFRALESANVKTAAKLFAEGLETYTKLYRSEAFWQERENKARALASAGHPFDQRAFATWRQNTPYRLAEQILQQVFRLVPGTLASPPDKAELEALGAARQLTKVLRPARSGPARSGPARSGPARSGRALDPATAERIAETLARHYLDPDPTQVTHFEAAARRAQQVLDLDLENRPARIFLLRAATHHCQTAREQGTSRPEILAKTLADLRDHAAWLAKDHEHLPADRQARSKSDLVAFWDELGTLHHIEGHDEVGRYNTLASPSSTRARTSLERIKRCYRDSDAAFRKSLELESFNPTAEDRIAHHAKEYQQIESVLRQIRMFS